MTTSITKKVAGKIEYRKNITTRARIALFLTALLGLAVIWQTGFAERQSASPASCIAPPTGMVAWYPGDGNGDEFQLGNGGVAQGSVTYVSGKVGQAMLLGGNGDLSGNGDRLVVGNPPELRLQDFTIEAWIKRASSTRVSNNEVPGSPGGTFFAYGFGGYALGILRSGALFLTEVGISAVQSTATITDTNFHHVAVSKSGNQVFFYIDGVAGAPITYNATFSFAANAAIGARGDNDVRNAFFGTIDELQIFNRPLSPAEIGSNFNAGSNGNCKPSCVAPPNGAVAWFAGDGNSLDIQGGNNGQPQNGATFSPSRVGRSLLLDGTDDFVDVGDKLDMGTSDFTIETWIKGDPTMEQFGRIIDKGFATGYSLGRQGSTNKVSFEFLGSGSQGSLFSTTSNVIDNAWHHVAVVKAGNTATIYADGVAENSETVSIASQSNSLPLFIGYNPGEGIQGHWKGNIDEVTFYNRALLIGEIQSIYAAAAAGKCKSQSANFCGVISGTVTDNLGTLPGSLVQACDSNGFCAFNSTTDAGGNYQITGLPLNTTFDLTVFPPAGSVDIPGRLNGLTVQNCASPLTAQNVNLVIPGFLPPGIGLVPSVPGGGGVPVVNWAKPLTLISLGKSNGTASYTIASGSSVFSSGPMNEGPAGTYTASVAPVIPNHGPAVVTITIIYPGPVIVIIPFNIYIDPSGVVVDTTAQPISGATVTLFRSDTESGTYTQVPNGNAIMSPSNRQNPDTTNSEGRFGWDVLAGYYKVRAQKSGCHAPGSPLQPFVETGALLIPPPVTDLVLTLECEAASPSPTPSPSLSGTLTYGNAIPAATRFVSNALISGAGSPSVSVFTGAPGAGAGTYSLSGFGSGSYIVTPTKTGGVNNSISSFDAARIAQHVAGISNLTGNQLIVADVSNNGSISSFDAGQIANYVVSASPSGIAGTWKFNPVNRTYASVASSINGEDFSALLMGEVSGNWNNTGARPGTVNSGRWTVDSGGTVDSGQWKVDSEDKDSARQRIAVAVPEVLTAADKEIVVPVTVDGIADKGVISYEFDLRYDPSVMQPLVEAVDVSGTVSRGLSVVTNATEPGLLRVVVYGAYPIDGDGVLLNLRFAAVGGVGAVSPISFERIMFNEGESRVTITDGKIELLD